MARTLRAIFHTLSHYSLFENYYASVVKDGRTGVPTADEARRDIERRESVFVRLGGL